MRMKLGNSYSNETKIKLVKTYLKLGNLSAAAKRMRIPYETVASWKYRTAWWPELVQKLRDETDTRLASKMEDVIEKAVDEIKERVENGEKILDSKSGKVIEIPVKASALNQVVKTLSDRQDILIGRQKADTISKQTIQDKLELLAKQFEKFSKQHKPLEIVDAEYSEVPEETLQGNEYAAEEGFQQENH